MSNAEIRMKREKRMTNETRPPLVRRSFLILTSSLIIGGAGCFPKPNKANIALRREIQSMQEKVNALETRDKAAQARIAALETDRTIQTLPAEKMQRLFTASGIKFKNLTLGQDLDRSRPGDEGFKIAIAPIDQFGDEFKCAGSLKVELFDLAAPDTRLGTWSLDTAETQRRWLSTPVIDGYVLTFPWQTPPTREKLLVKVAFTEELTGGVFEGQADLKIAVPAQ